MKLKLRLCIFISIFFCLALFCHVKANEFEEEPFVGAIYDLSGQVAGKVPDIDAKAAIVMDTVTGRVLYEKNAYSKVPIASTTKIMTAIVALENGDLNDMVTVSERAASIWGSRVNLKIGEQISLHDLMYGMMIKSGNDAAIAIAEHIGGTVENFLDMMNKKARELGAYDTQFKSPHGLDMEGHYSTAYDLALITRYALENPVFSKIVSTVSINIKDRNLYNTNEMLTVYQGADGVKTGYTGKAGRCLVTSATRENWRIISVVLNCSSRTQRARSSKAILDYAFNNYKFYTLLSPDEVLCKLPVENGLKTRTTIVPVEGVILPLREDEAALIQKKVQLPGKIKAPVYSNIEVGSVSFYLSGEVLATTKLKTADNVGKKRFGHFFMDVILEWCNLMR